MASDLPKSPGHPFYTALNRLLGEHGLDPIVGKRRASHYARSMGRPGVPPGVFFRILLTGSFEGLRKRPRLDRLVAALVWSATHGSRAPGT